MFITDLTCGLRYNSCTSGSSRTAVRIGWSFKRSRRRRRGRPGPLVPANVRGARRAPLGRQGRWPALGAALRAQVFQARHIGLRSLVGSELTGWGIFPDVARHGLMMPAQMRASGRPRRATPMGSNPPYHGRPCDWRAHSWRPAVAAAVVALLARRLRELSRAAPASAAERADICRAAARLAGAAGCGHSAVAAAPGAMATAATGPAPTFWRSRWPTIRRLAVARAEVGRTLAHQITAGEGRIRRSSCRASTRCTTSPGSTASPSSCRCAHRRYGGWRSPKRRSPPAASAGS